MKYVRFCPKCRSLNIRSKLLGFFGLPAKYKCGNCSYQAYVFPMVSVDDLKKFGKKKRSDRK